MDMDTKFHIFVWICGMIGSTCKRLFPLCSKFRVQEENMLRLDIQEKMDTLFSSEVVTPIDIYTYVISFGG